MFETKRELKELITELKQELLHAQQDAEYWHCKYNFIANVYDRLAANRCANRVKLQKENEELKKEVEYWKQDCKKSDDKVLLLMDQVDALKNQVASFSTYLDTDNVLYASERWRGVQLTLARQHNRDLEKTINKLEDKLYKIGNIVTED